MQTFLRQMAMAWRRARMKGAWWAAVVLLAASASASITAALAYRAVVLKPLPGTRAAEIVALGGLAYGGGIIDPPAWWGRAPSVEHIAIYRVGDSKITCPGITRWIRVAEVSAGFFDVFDQVILEGRRILKSDEEGYPQVIVLRADAMRQANLGVGAECQLGRHRVIVIAKADSALQFPSGAQAWIPRSLTEEARPPLVEGGPGLAPMRSRTGWVALPKAGVAPGQVRTEMRALLEETNAALTPKTGVRYGTMVAVSLLGTGLTAAVRPALIVLLISTLVTFVLCLGSAVIHMMASFHSRRRDFAIHACLGAPARYRAEVIAADSLLFALATMLLAATLTTVFVPLAENYLAGFRTFVSLRSGSPSFIGTAMLAMLPLVVGAVALGALLGSRTVRVRGEGRLMPEHEGRSARVARRVFVGVASAGATFLLAGTLVAQAALADLLNMELGYVPQNVASIRLSLQRASIDGPHYARRRSELAAAAKSAGLTSVTFANALPIREEERGFQSVIGDEQKVMASVHQVEANFFDVLGVPVAGRTFGASRTEVVLNQSAADRLYPSGAIGNAIRFDGGQDSMTVVGVVPDLRTVDQGNSPIFEIYREHVPVDGTEMPNNYVQVQLLGTCGANCRNTVDDLVEGLSTTSGVVVLRGESLQSAIDAARGNSVVAARLWTLFGILTVGVSVLAMSSMARQNALRIRREIGLRLALGANRWQALAQLVGEPMFAGSVGVGLGLIGLSMSLRALQAVTGAVALPSVEHAAVAGLLLLLSALIATTISAAKTVWTPPSVLLRTSDTEVL